jgi:hypothetical protein
MIESFMNREDATEHFTLGVAATVLQQLSLFALAVGVWAIGLFVAKMAVVLGGSPAIFDGTMTTMTGLLGLETLSIFWEARRAWIGMYARMEELRRECIEASKREANTLGGDPP